MVSEKITGRSDQQKDGSGLKVQNSVTVDLEQRGLELCGSTHTRVFFDSNYYSITWPVDSGCRGMADTEAL